MIKTYRFKYDNVDLKSYIEERRFITNLKRQEAEKLRLAADTIDEETRVLEAALIPEEKG